MEVTKKKEANLTDEDDNIIRYSVTGRAAHERVGRLLRRVVVDEEEAVNEVEGSNVDDIDRGGRQSSVAVTTTKRWIDLSPYATHADNNNESQDDGNNNNNNNNNNAVVLDFLWENAPRSETKHGRDYVKCYSHLPNGSILDDKWALARLMGHSSSFCTSGVAASGDGYYCNMRRRGGHRERRTTKEESLSTTSANSYYDNDTNHRRLATLESHCFRGTNGFEIFAKRVGLLQQQQPPTTTLMNNNITTSTSATTDADQTLHKYQFEDLISRSSTTNTSPMTNEDSVGPPPMPSNLWVIKDSNSNGAGGIWIIDESNVYDFISPNDNDQVSSGNYDDDIDNTNSSLQIENKSTKTSSSSSSSPPPTPILNPNHRYVAQRYAWPPTLHSGRKCHVRAYVLLTCDGCAYLHRRAFLHVANEPFVYDNNSSNDTTTTTSGRGKAETIFDPSIHITNCCANSHDSTKFTGEICADLESMSYANNCCDNDHSKYNNNDPLPLGEYLPSISASVASIASSFRPFLKGGDANNGFEYLGLDFILSSMEVDEGLDDPTEELQRRPRQQQQQQRLPVAYLLEINAPPSQDTATGLRHAEMLHDDVISDLLRMWVLPNVATTTYDNNAVCDNNGGWRCVYTPPPEESTIANDDIAATTSNKSSERSNLILPSKAAILNRIHWAMFESRVSKEYELYWKKYDEQSRNDELILLSSSKDINFCESSSSKIHHVSFDQQHSIDDFVIFVRSQFPYYSTATYAVDDINTTTRDNTSSRTQRHASIFFESGGGSQIPQQVVDAMYKSVCYRDRSVVGSQLEREARIALASLLINNKKGTSLIQRRSIPPIGNDNDDEYVTILGSNATSLLDLLARRMFASGILCHGDEIVVASENHLANVFPWLDLATKIDGEVQVKWWTVDATFNTEKSDIDHCMYQESSCLLSDLITERTKIVAISHVSNILGLERDIFAVCELVNRITKGKGHVVVDGVAAAPHFLSSNILSSIFSPAWYVVSLHKFFGPHLGCLLGKRSAVLQMTERSVNDTMCGEEKSMETDSALSLYVSNETLAKSWELGTMNYEACSGAAALLKYVEQIGVNACVTFDIECHKCSTQQASNQITSESADIQSSSTVYLNIVSTCIHHLENRLVNHLLGYFLCVPLVRIIQDVGKMKVVNNILGNRIGRRVPIICFTHANISSQAIVAHCRHHGVLCRSCKFLATDRLLDEMGINTDFVRFSLAHYNTQEEIVESIRVLESLAGWI